MIRIAGVNLPSKKALFIALTYIYGIGRSSAEKICLDLNLDKYEKIENISNDAIASIRALIEKSFIVEGDLRKLKQQHIKRLQHIACYRGIRSKQKLPSRGQRTHTNAKTVKRVN